MYLELTNLTKTYKEKNAVKKIIGILKAEAAKNRRKKT